MDQEAKDPTKHTVTYKWSIFCHLSASAGLYTSNPTVAKSSHSHQRLLLSPVYMRVLTLIQPGFTDFGREGGRDKVKDRGRNG